MGRTITHMRTAIPTLMLLAGFTLCVASAVHFGVPIPLGVVTVSDPFAGAAVPELILGIVMLASGLAATARVQGAWLIAIVSTGFSLLLTLYGTSITVGSADWGDVSYHAVLLTVLGVILVLLVAARRGQARRGAVASARGGH